MSNSRSFRRSLKASGHVRPSGEGQRPPRWNKGLAMTTDPSDSTTNRWLNAAEDEGILERSGTRRTGKPGRPPVTRDLTEKGVERAGHLPPKAIMQERLRRQENARKRGTRPKGARVTQADMTLAAGMMIRATGKLIEACGDDSVLERAEVEALVKFGCATWKDGTLILTSAWLDDYLSGLLGPQAGAPS
jgi:DNA-binding PadR family transcriptional regulator